jgi:hypothetical protein
MDPITKAFIAQVEQFAKQEKVPVVTFEKGQRKDDVAAEYRRKFRAQEGYCSLARPRRRRACFGQSDAQWTDAASRWFSRGAAESPQPREKC